MRRGETLLIDADDTLWENNIHFEAVVRAFCELVEARGASRQEARETLNAIERVRTRVNGYGVKNFRGSLAQACAHLLPPGDGSDVVARLDVLCADMARQALTLLPEVADTVRELAGRHRTILFTKGDLDDQVDKLQRSGLTRYLHRVDVVREKDADAYRQAITRHGLRPRRSWMIGNSPRSDVLPALEAGLGAVFIPHDATWELEQDEVPAPHGRLLVLSRFADLLQHF